MKIVILLKLNGSIWWQKQPLQTGKIGNIFAVSFYALFHSMVGDNLKNSAFYHWVFSVCSFYSFLPFNSQSQSYCNFPMGSFFYNACSHVDARAISS